MEELLLVSTVEGLEVQMVMVVLKVLVMVLVVQAGLVMVGMHAVHLMVDIDFLIVVNQLRVVRNPTMVRMADLVVAVELMSSRQVETMYLTFF